MSLLQETIQQIASPNQQAVHFVETKLNNLISSSNSLGELQRLLLKYVGITGQTNPQIPKKCTIITCADHGVAEMNVSAYPQETTAHMTRNYIESKGAVANAMSNFCGSDMLVVDMGIKHQITDLEGILDKRIAAGTQNFTKGPAMTREQAIEAIEAGISIVKEAVRHGYRCFLPGEMGIANTSSSAAMVACLCGLTPEQATGRGTNISDSRLKVKIEVVRKGLEVNQPDPNDGIDVMAKLGGFELACITGIILGAAANRCFVVLDGFNTGSAALVAQAICPTSSQYLMASHLAAEPAHQAILQKLNLAPYMDLKFRLGEATGSSIAVNILDCAIKIYQELTDKSLHDTNNSISTNIPFVIHDDAIDYPFKRPVIAPPDEEIRQAARFRIDNLTKPIYSLGRLEEIAEKIASIIHEEKPISVRKKIIVITSREGCNLVQHRFTQALAAHAKAKYHFTATSVNDYELPHLSMTDILNDGYSYGLSIENVDVLGLSFSEANPQEIFGTFAFNCHQDFVNNDGTLRYSVDELLQMTPTPLLRDIIFTAGIAIGAASQGVLVLSDNVASMLALHYAQLIVPDIKPYLMYVKPEYIDLDITANGGAICALGMKLIDASLQMMKDMKTFAEAGVAIANDGPGAGRQVDK